LSSSSPLRPPRGGGGGSGGGGGGGGGDGDGDGGGGAHPAASPPPLLGAAALARLDPEAQAELELMVAALASRRVRAVQRALAGLAELVEQLV